MKGNFKIIFLIIFLAGAGFAMFVFAGIIPLGGKKGGSGSLGTVVLWGTEKISIMNPLIEVFNRSNTDFSVKYVEKRKENFDGELLEAFASGKAPDMFFISDDLAFKYSNKIFTIPYQSFPISNFKNNFVGASDVFLTSKGILAFPIAVDPMVMYYNRSMLDAGGIVYPPSYWDEFEKIIPILTKRDEEKRIIKSAVAMGQFANVSHAKAIISALFTQTGNPIVKEISGRYVSTLNQLDKTYPLYSVLQFYTDFTDPSSPLYSWNRSLGNSQDFFTEDNLAFYFGFASELKSMINKNPNQNLQVASVPQIRGSNFKLTGARVIGIAVSATSKNFNTAFMASNMLSSGDFASKFALDTGMIPAQRKGLVSPPEDTYSPIFYASALYARSWLDPSPESTSRIFQEMIEQVLSNSSTPTNTIMSAHDKIGPLLSK